MNTNRYNEVLKHLEQLITLDISVRVKTLQSILNVYQSTYPFVRMSIPATEEKRLERANKAVVLGHGGKTPDEQETAFCTAIRIYEAVYQRIGGWQCVIGSLDQTYQVLAAKRVELIEAQRWAERKQAELEETLAPMLLLLNETFGRFGVTYKVSFTQAQPRLYNLSREITLGRDYMDLIKDMDPLKVVFTEAHTVARAVAVVKDTTGHYIVDTTQLNATLPQILTALYDLTQKRGMQFKMAVKRTVTTEKVTVERRWKHVPTVGKGGGLFRQGTYLALLYDRIVMCPGITFDELFEGVPAKDRDRMFATIAERGLVSKKFTLTRSGGKVVYQKQ